MKYPKIETLYDRNAKFKVDTSAEADYTHTRRSRGIHLGSLINRWAWCTTNALDMASVAYH